MQPEIALPRRYRISNALLWAVAAVTLLYLLLPQFVIVPLSFSNQSYLSFPPTGWSMQWYARVVENPAWARAAMNSLIIGVPTAVLSMILGTLAALAVSRGNLTTKGLVTALIVAPMMLPHVILAIGLYPMMLWMGLLTSYVGVIISHTVIGIPLVFISVNSALARHPASLELAAMTMGARPWQSFWKITFPLIRTGVIIGGILAFASSFDELMLSLFLTGVGTQTLPRLIWLQLADYLTPSIAAVATLILLFTLVLLLIVSVLQPRNDGLKAGAHG
ncbi:ABC-type spermidine/putrescine transport system permease subunit II [Rhodoligotrophos appendicifer]|uniref:ABC transporter permease n=1 Tax=Rhodoligotrophos appendicifer TaxID=987056 RepID=UPI00147978D1|nr:ABC transporter permease [Rhodoligotrophos appendicifer]